jgi:hypothetical protein
MKMRMKMKIEIEIAIEIGTFRLCAGPGLKQRPVVHDVTGIPH